MSQNLFKRSKWFRRLAWSALGVLILWGVTWAVVPPFIKKQAEKVASELLGRTVTIGAVDFKPWTLELALSDLAVAGAADGPAADSPQLQVKRIYIDAELQSLLRLAPVVDALTVEDPVLRLTYQGGGHYDIDDMLARLVQPAKNPTGWLPRFAFYNLSLTGGRLDFNDQSVNRTHELRDLTVSVPFLSNLESKREVKTELHVAFKLNGSQFDSAAQGMPFASTHKTDARLRLVGFDLKPYWGYFPAALPVKVQAAVLDADVKLAFEQSDKAVLKLGGTLQASGVRLADAAAQEWLGVESLTLTLDEVRPLEQWARISALELKAPLVSLRRDGAGRLNFPTGSGAGVAPSGGGDKARNQAAESVVATPPGPWHIEMGKVSVRGGVARWRDETTQPRADISLRDLTLDASDLAWPWVRPLQFSGSAAIDAKPESARLRFSGSATAQAARVDAALDGLPLAVAAPYVAQVIEPVLAGQLSTQLELSWTAPEVHLKVKDLTLDNMGLTQGSGRSQQTLAAVKKLQLSEARIDVSRRSVMADKVVVSQPKVKLSRDAERRWMFERWLKPAPVDAPPRSTAQKAKPQGPSKPWSIVLSEGSIEGGAIAFEDRSTARSVTFDVSALTGQMKNFATDGKKPSLLNVSARLKAAQGEAGQLVYQGSFGLNPLLAQGQLQADRIPAHAFAPYLAEVLNIELLRADASFKGTVRYAGSPTGSSAGVRGDAVLEEFQANRVQSAGSERPTPNELLNWKVLNLRGIDVSLAPGLATRVEVRETVLTDFFARLTLNETGRFNLQDLVKPSAASAPTAAATDAAALEPVIQMGPISFVNGKVRFSDRFIKPNYTANLSELNGNLSAFSSQTQQDPRPLADLELRGLAEGTASLEILGKINPLAKPLALDIQGKVRDLELPPLSPYAVKYAGYGIERGKLSMEVSYFVRPDGQLIASNNLVLKQLTFGDPVENAPKSLPVKLAAALLADRNGVIDINLPISGSLNDPEFRLGPLIFKAIVNLIGKAISSPFSLLARVLGGGGDELSRVSFPAGSAELTPDARQRLDQVAQALAERPGLQLTVVGTASLAKEREAYQRERLKEMLQAEKRRQAELAGQAATAVTAVAEAEVPRLTKEVYRRADIPKPRNLLGLAKDLSVAEMQALLLAHIPVSEERLDALAAQRGMVVKAYLLAKQIAPDRLFLGAAKSQPADDAWTPRAELNLTTN